MPDRSHEQSSLSDDATAAGAANRPGPSSTSLGDERTVGGDAGSIDTLIDGLEVVDLEVRYTIEGALGQGGMGAVLLATDTRLGRKVAIKRILGEAAGNKISVARFLTEAKAIAALNHPNIVQIYDYGRSKDGPFLIMEYVDGGSLAERCRAGAIPLDEAIHLACHVCDGLAKAHDGGIVHRDIKPANILLTKDGVPKLTDFGLAKVEAASHGHTITGTGAVMGTPDFMPPEQRRDAADVDHRSDLWSLAATIYQMVTGRSPRIIRFNDILPALQGVLGKALEEQKDARYQSAREFGDALKSAQRGNRKALVGLPPDGVLQEGQCKSCGTVNPLTRKFCRDPQCGTSLRVACLKCQEQIAVWDAICGECGGNQLKLLAALRKSLESKRVKAESLFADLAFEEAVGIARPLANESRVELAELAAWATSFIESVAAEKTRRCDAATKQVQDAKKHMDAWDYPAAIHAIESIPEKVRDDEATAVLTECLDRRNESDALIRQIADRVRRKEVDGLVPLIDRAIRLRGDRQDLCTLLQQLQQRREGRLAAARESMDKGDLRAAVRALAGAAPEDLDASSEAIFDRVRTASQLEERLVAAVVQAKADGVVDEAEAREIKRLAEAYLDFNPNNEKAQDLVRQCRQILRTPRQFQNTAGMLLKRIPVGTFTMGESHGLNGDRLHHVTLSHSFYLGVFPVTNAEWHHVMGSVPSRWKHDDGPVENVSWENAVEFCQKLSRLPAEQRAGRLYRLPTEAEWEYACRAGTTTRYSFGDDEAWLGEYGWFEGNSRGQTHPVGQKKPNPWGLYDMHGNVFEWCSDWYGDYGSHAITDPQGPSRSSDRVARGGGWISTAGCCRSASRDSLEPSGRRDSIGFRIAMSAPHVTAPEAAAGG